VLKHANQGVRPASILEFSAGGLQLQGDFAVAPDAEIEVELL
jgi:hypothetical protein